MIKFSMYAARVAVKSLTPFALAALLSACAAVSRPDSPALYDLGPLRSTGSATAPGPALPALPPISVAEIGVPNWLDRPTIFYRLEYANGQQPRPYTQARWTMPPAQLLQQHLKARIAQAGGAVLSPTDGANNVPVLRIEVDTFIQNFTSPEQSTGKVGMRASVFKGRSLLAQRSFHREAPAPSANADGGVRALAAASDAVIVDTMMWLGTLDLK
ncbi:ABC-type transport auxiliary lipoprotein family protein [Herbaspirillum sp. GCM10030257]|uniref:ABC-type transport auxiliary lipoprotein family protein n=1 Tax=Herbaspirillum sp. GCM10030257 TaxID=3273393 RepID=UPI00360E22EA